MVDRRDYLTSICALLMVDKAPLFLTDPFVNADPSEDMIVYAGREAIAFVRKFGIVPKLALVSHSNYGSYDDSAAIKMKRATRRLKAQFSDVDIEGEMNAYTAFHAEERKALCADNDLTGNANVLIMPNMDAANATLGALRSLTTTRTVGPFLTGTHKAHILIPSVSTRGIFNMVALMVADLHAQKIDEDFIKPS